jgi:uncharacterized membrane protein required for colicin V production
MVWNWLDLVILLVLGLNVFNGARRGLVRSLFGLIALILALFVCFKGTPFIAEILRQFNLTGMPIFVTALIVVFLAIYWLVNEVGRHFKILIAESSFQQIDTVGGIALGFSKGILYTLFFLVPILGNIFASPTLMETFETSTLLQVGRPLVYAAEPFVSQVIEQGSQHWQSYQETVPKILESDDRWHTIEAAAQPLTNY